MAGQNAKEEKPKERANGRMGPMHWEQVTATTAADKGISRGIAPSPKAKVRARAKMEETGGNRIGTTKEESQEERQIKKAKEVKKEENLGMEKPWQEKDPEQDAGGAEEHTSKTSAPKEWERGRGQCRKNSTTGTQRSRKCAWSGGLNLNQWNMKTRLKW